jgi:nitrite reductase/ring-hydroxylating ferredoxin subunit
MGISAVNLWSWHPVVASADLLAGGLMRVTLQGEALVVWRSQEGRVGVWNDRCPHRGMSLSFGATIGDTLVCPYHGWVFGSDGNCRRIPAHPELTPSRAARTRVYPVVEASSYVWACLGEPLSEQPEGGLVAGSVLQPVRSMHVRADAETVAQILLAHPLSAKPMASAEYRQDVDILTARHAGESGTAICRVQLESAPVVVCELDTATEASTYAAFVQPVDETTSVIHLALIGEGPQSARLALNEALVRLRGAIPALASGQVLPELHAQ